MTGTPPREIKAGPVLLRALQAVDFDALWAVIKSNLSHLHQYMVWSRTTHEEAYRTWLVQSVQAFPEGRAFGYGVWIGDRVVGVVELHNPGIPRAWAIGYWISGAETGRGYATIAAGAVTDAALQLPAIDRVFLYCDVANRASAGVAKNLGFRLDGIVAARYEAAPVTGLSMVWIKEKRLPSGYAKAD